MKWPLEQMYCFEVISNYLYDCKYVLYFYEMNDMI